MSKVGVVGKIHSRVGSRSTMKGAGKFVKLLEDKDFMLDVAYLADIFHHMNCLNTQLQRRCQCIVDLFEKVSAFAKKLQVLSADLQSKMIHFPRLRAIIEASEDDVTITSAMTNFLSLLQDNFANRFSDFTIHKRVMTFVRNPFTWEAPEEMDAFFELAGLTTDAGTFEMELIDLKASSEQHDRFVSNNYEKFWVDIDAMTYPTLKQFSLYFLTMFGST